MPNRLSNAELLGRLVAFDTTSHHSNLPMVEFVSDYLDRRGVTITRHPSPDGDKANLVIRIGPETDGDRAGLVLSGHMDVVPAEEPSWHSHPFTLTRAGDAYVGRGTCDMKGFVALSMNVAAAQNPARLRAPLVLVLTYDEEVGTIGARHLADTWDEPGSLPRQGIVGEPTSLGVVRMHKGHLRITLALAGEGAHSAYPHLGTNAIEPAGLLVLALSQLRRTMEIECPPNREHFPEVPYVTLNVARITGGTAVNIVPDRCVIECGLRLLPGMNRDDMIERIETFTRKTLGSTPVAIDVVSEAPPMLLSDEAPIYRALCAAVGQQSTLSASYATDAGWLQTMGIDSAIFGPGTIEVAHKPNEHLPIAQFERAADILSDVVARFCGVA